MILLDTNVLSALMLAEPDPTVVEWLDSLDPASIWTTSVTVFEVRFGLSRRDAGRKTDRLEKAFQSLISEDLEGRIATLDKVAAEAAGFLAARRAAVGKPVDFRDTLIAGIAVARNAKIATRNVRHFVDIDVGIIDPWQGAQV